VTLEDSKPRLRMYKQACEIRNRGRLQERHPNGFPASPGGNIPETGSRRTKQQCLVAQARVTAISWRKSPGERVRLQLPRRKSVPEIASDVGADRRLRAEPVGVSDRQSSAIASHLSLCFTSQIYIYISMTGRTWTPRRAFIARAYHASARFIVGDK